MATKALGTLTLDLVARIGGFEQGMDRAARSAERSSQRISSSASIAAKAVTGLFAVVSVGAFAGYIKSSVDAASATLDVANKLGMTTDELSKLRYAANQAGIESGKFDIALQRQTRRLAEAARGTGVAADAVIALGLSAKQLSEAGPDEAFKQIAEAMGQVEDQGEKLRIAFKLWDTAGADIVRVTTGGRAAVEALGDEFERLGGVIRQDFAESAQALNTELFKVGVFSRGVANELASRVLPALNDVMRGFGQDAQGNIVRTADALHLAANAGIALAAVYGIRVAASLLAFTANFAAATVQLGRHNAALAATAGMSRTAAAGVGVLTASVRGLSGAMALLGGPWGVAIAAVGALAYLGVTSRGALEGLNALRPEVDRLALSLDTLSRADARRGIVQIEKSLAAAKEQSESARKEVARLEQSIKNATSIKPLELLPQGQQERVRGWINQVEELRDRLQEAGENVEYFNQVLERLRGVASGSVGGVTEDAVQISDAYKKLAAQLEEQIALIGKTGEAAKLEYQIRNGLIEGLKEGEGDLLIALARRRDATQKAYELSQKQRAEAEANAKAIADAVKRLEDQAAAVGKTRTETELYRLASMGAGEGQLELARAALEAVEAHEKQTKALADYRAVMESLRTPEEQATELLRQRKEVLDAAGLSAEAYADAMERASKATLDEAPRFAGVDALIGGPAGELLKIAEAEQELSKWYDKQLAMQRQFLDQKIINHETYAARVAEVERASQQELSRIQSAYQTAMLAMFAGVTGQVADMLREMGHEGSALYKAMFLASKAASIAQAVINTELAYTQALAMPLGAGLAIAPWIRGLGYASVALMAATSITGMAHDGIDSVPREGTWLLDRGERVVDARTNEDLKRFLSRVNQTTGAPQINVQVNIDGDGAASVAANGDGAQQFGNELARFVEQKYRQLLTRDLGDGGQIKRAMSGGYR